MKFDKAKMKHFWTKVGDVALIGVGVYLIAFKAMPYLESKAMGAVSKMKKPVVIPPAPTTNETKETATV
jgi:hypothetical protein